MKRNFFSRITRLAPAHGRPSGAPAISQTEEGNKAGLGIHAQIGDGREPPQKDGGNIPAAV